MADRIAEMEQRLAALEAESKEFGSVESANGAGQTLVAYQAQMLERLVEIREALAVAGGGDSSLMTKERDALKEENAKLKKEIEKLNYRIMHLVKHVN